MHGKRRLSDTLRAGWRGRGSRAEAVQSGPAPMRTHGTTTSTSDDGFRRLGGNTGVGRGARSAPGEDAGVARGRRWTDEEKAWIVAESLDPATTTSGVARRYGLHPSQLFVCVR